MFIYNKNVCACVIIVQVQLVQIFDVAIDGVIPWYLLLFSAQFKLNQSHAVWLSNGDFCWNIF